VVKEKFMSSSNWSSAVRHAAAAAAAVPAAAAAALCYIARCTLLKLQAQQQLVPKQHTLTASHQQ
jgi:hypothetical protein